jgi:GAF domain-containing protein
MPDVSAAQQRFGVPSEEVLDLVSGYLTDVAGRAHHRLGDVVGVALTTAVDGGEPMTTGASTDQAAEIDLVQYAVGLGPCLHALQGGGGTYVPDLADDDRWGEYGQAAAEHGARSCISVPVQDDDARVVGVLKVYASEVDGLDAEQQALAEDVALEMAGGFGLASALVATSYELSDRIEAMDSRRTIDLATGVLMGRLGISAADAFAALRRESQNQNTKLRDVAAKLLSVSSPDSADGSGTSGSQTGEAPFSRRGEAPAPGH